MLFAGRFHTVKGIDILLHAWKVFQAQASETALRLAGEGEEMGQLGALSQGLGVAERVRFMGRVQQRDLASLYRNAELVVIPSRNERFPRVALKAGACGAVCVATRVGGLPEVIEDGVTGFLVEPESPEALADAVLHVLRLPTEDRRRMGEAAKRRIAHHSPQERTTASYEALFRSVLESPRR